MERRMAGPAAEGHPLFPPVPCQGLKERPFYHRIFGTPVYSFYHYPAGADILPPLSGMDLPCGEGSALLMVPPFAEEKVKTHRLFTNFARLLSLCGFHVLRFDYRGEGDSAGDFEFSDLETRLEDTMEMGEFLRKESGATRLILLGGRLGASLSALAGLKIDAEGLILWSPVIDPGDFLFRALRANLATQMLVHRKVVKPREEIVRELEGGGRVNVDGYTITGRFYLQARGMNLLKEIEGNRWEGDLFIGDVSKRKEPAEEMLSLFNSFPLKSPASEFKLLPFEFSWTETKFYMPRPLHLFRETLHWLKRVQEDGGMDLPAIEGGIEGRGEKENGWSTEGYGEEIVSLEGEGGARLYGILTIPEGGVRGALILLNTGLNYRIAWHRLNLKIARRMAKEGFASLRLDTHGVGDSRGEVDETTDIIRHFDFIQMGSFVEDSKKGVDYLVSRFGRVPVIPVGLCGGAVTGIALAGEKEEIRKAVLICGPATLSKSADLDEVRPWNAPIILSAYMKKIFNPVSWFNFLAGRSDYKLIFRSIKVSLMERIKGMRRGGEKGMGEKEKDLPAAAPPPPEKGVEGLPDRDELILNPLYVSSLKGHLEKGGEVLLIFAEHDRATHEFHQLKESYLPRESPLSSRVEVHIVKGANHAFHSDEAQQELLDLLARWMGRG